MVLFGTVRANGAVFGAADHPRHRPLSGPARLRARRLSWLGADALWFSFPVSSFANMAMAIAFYLHGGWKKARMDIGHAPPVDEQECVEEALAAAPEPGGRLNPAG